MVKKTGNMKPEDRFGLLQSFLEMDLFLVQKIAPLLFGYKDKVKLTLGLCLVEIYIIGIILNMQSLTSDLSNSQVSYPFGIEDFYGWNLQLGWFILSYRFKMDLSS